LRRPSELAAQTGQVTPYVGTARFATVIDQVRGLDIFQLSFGHPEIVA
jgi:hypothetical protein